MAFTQNNLYSQSLIKDNNLSFPTDMKIWEDLQFNLKYGHYADKISLFSRSLYHYRINVESVMNKSEQILVGQYNLLYLNYREFCDKTDSFSIFTDFNFRMAEGVFNNLYPRLSVKPRSVVKIISAVAMNTQLLSGFAPRLLQFELNKVSGYQKYKKKLLMQGNLRTFTILDALRNYFLK
jgi:hypothetical protein